MRGVELRHLVALDAIAVHGSFGRAALELGYTQSAVSQQIATLEKRLGETLLVRGGGAHTVSFTPAGLLMCQHAREIVKAMAAVEADLAALDGERRRTVRLGVFQSAGATIVPRVLQRLGADRHHIEVDLESHESLDRLEEGVADGTLDLAFTLLPVPDESLASLWLMDDPYHLVVRRDDPLASRGALSTADIPGGPMVGYKSCRVRFAIDDVLAHNGTDVTWVSRTDENGTVQGLAAAGVGRAVMAWLSIDPHDARVAVLPLRDMPPRQIGLVWHAQRALPSSVSLFIEAAREVCDALAAQQDVKVAS